MCYIAGNYSGSYGIFIRLEARLQPNIGFTLQRVLAVFSRSAITPPKVNRFGWHLEHSKNIVGGWLWQILSAITTARELGEANFFFASDKQRTISPIFSRPNFMKFERNNVDRCRVAIRTFGTEFENFAVMGRFPKRKYFSRKCLTSSDFRPS